VRLTPDAMRLLSEYHWPGNVRELRNVLERVYVETGAQAIGRNAFNEWVRERDYLSAGGWNLERLEMQRATAPILITPAGSAEPSRVSRLPIAASHLPQPPLFPLAFPPATYAPGERTIDAAYSVERPPARKAKALTEEIIRRAFADAGGNATQASRLLGVHKATLYRHMKALGLNRKDLERPAVSRSVGEPEASAGTHAPTEREPSL